MNAPVRIDVGSAKPEYAAFTDCEFWEMIARGAFDGMRVELVGGKIRKMAPASGGHSRTNFTLAQKIATAFSTSGKQVDIGTDLAVSIDATTTRGLDIAVSLGRFADSGSTEASAIFLGVEISDTTLARDLGEKASDYARGGIPHYWVVDIKAQTIHVMSEPSPDGYAKRQVVRFGEKLKVPGSEETITIT